MVIGGDKFCGNPAQWADVKTEIVSATANAGFSQITEMGTALFQIAGSGEHSDESSTNQKHTLTRALPPQLVTHLHVVIQAYY